MAANNQESLLVRPSAKKNSVFPRCYPFPIVKDESDENAAFNCMIGHLKDQCVEVIDEENINVIFTMGFFGKGTLSRSTPRALEESLTKEHDEKRKKQRKYWQKSKRNSQNKKEDADLEIVVADKNEGKPFKRRRKDEIEVVLSDSNSSDSDDASTRVNAPDSISSSQAKSIVKEPLQLTFEEAYFLSYGLGCLVVKDKDQPLDLMRLWHKFCELHPAQNFPVMYTAYHHFRSKGWVVRNGLKYGTDYLLYKDGPPFYHASYAVIVKAVKDQNLRDIVGTGHSNFTWSSLSGLNRICTHVSKAVMILYVIKPGTISENKISTPFCVSQFKLEEVIVKRWVPSQNRSED